jgi:serine-type D-Ala-D-Ala carboxypeptidase/endopeptidase (penicillin-binding protein 4)
MKFFGFILLLPQLVWAQVQFDSLLKQYALKAQNQSICYSNPEGVVLGHQVDQRVIPASVTKLYTSYVALKALGSRYQFETKFALSQESGSTVLEMRGDHDAYFVAEHLFFLLSKLNNLGVQQIDEVRFDEKFYVNFYLDHSSIKMELLKYLNTANWSQKTKDWYLETASKVQDYGLEMMLQLPSMRVPKVTFVTNLSNEKTTFSFKSSPLVKHLKEMNIYSNNYYAQAIYQKIGAIKYNEILHQALSTHSKQLYFANGSGLPGNYTTCRLTLMLLDQLKKELKLENLDLQNIVSLAGFDQGTLLHRFKNYETAHAVVAKTGTLPSLSISTLSGVVNTREGERFFGIFNHYIGSSMEKSKKFQELVVESILDEFHGKEEYAASPWSYFALEDLQVL